MGRLFLLFAAAAFLAACATAPSGARGASNLITQEEVAETTAENAYDVIHRLRPRWLATRGQISLQDPRAGYAVVYVDGIRFGELETLRSIPTGDIKEIRYQTASEATTWRGTGHAGGAILVSTRR